MKIVFVDGYNVINNWPDLKKCKDYSFYSARQSLIDKLHNYAVYNECKIVIVFDAYKVRNNLEKKEKMNKNISVVFTKDGETADGYIEKEVHRIGRRFEVYVVTSDWLEQQTIFQRGAVRVAVLEFYNEVLKTEDKISKKANRSNIVNKNHLGDNIDGETLKKLECIRKGE